MKTPRDKIRGPVTVHPTTGGDVGYTVTASDEFTSAMNLKPAPNSSSLANNLLTFFDDTGAAVGDIDSGGNMFFYPGGTTRFYITHTGQLFLRGDSANISNGLVIQVQVTGGRSPLQVLVPGFGGRSVEATAIVDGDVALRLGPFDENNDALDIVGGPDYNGGEYRIWGDGKFSTKAHTAPADGDLVAGECAFWFDQTNGAPRFKIKAKQADGTVVTGTVVLA